MLNTCHQLYHIYNAARMWIVANNQFLFGVILSVKNLGSSSSEFKFITILINMFSNKTAFCLRSNNSLTFQFSDSSVSFGVRTKIP